MKKNKVVKFAFSSSQITTVVGLGVVSMLMCFYLGYVVGKSLRNPNEAVPLSEAMTKAPATGAKAPGKDSLKFFDLGAGVADNKGNPIRLEEIDKLKANTEKLKSANPSEAAANNAAQETVAEQVQQKTESEIEEASQEAELSNILGALEKPETPPAPETKVTPSPPTTLKAVVKLEAPIIPQEQKTLPKPAQTPVSEVTRSELYTLQVFTSRNRQSAEGLISKLRENGFPDAYLHTFVTPANEVLYRVRVGKMEKSATENVAQQLKKLKFIEAVQLTKL